MTARASQPPAEVTVAVNGASRSVPSGSTLALLVADLGLAGRPIAVEVDGVVVSRADLTERRVRGGERIEIVSFVGGG